MFGALCIPPIYVYKCAFSGGLFNYQSEDVVFGVFSVVFWTITLTSLIKYAAFVLSANDNGEGESYQSFVVVFADLRGVMLNVGLYICRRGYCIVCVDLSKCETVFDT